LQGKRGCLASLPIPPGACTVLGLNQYRLLLLVPCQPASGNICAPGLRSLAGNQRWTHPMKAYSHRKTRAELHPLRSSRLHWKSERSAQQLHRENTIRENFWDLPHKKESASNICHSWHQKPRVREAISSPTRVRLSSNISCIIQLCHSCMSPRPTFSDSVNNQSLIPVVLVSSRFIHRTTMASYSFTQHCCA
jgi:hypothetical protein